jgi:hypothetical protein
MSFVLPHPLDMPDLVLTPQNEEQLLRVIDAVANPRQRSGVVVDINKSVNSVRHKLSIAMYQTALICNVRADDYLFFEDCKKKKKKPRKFSRISYKGCDYSMRDLDHYRLLVMFFIETFSAACFSLLDVCGYLLNNLYDLGLTAKETSFHKSKQEIQKKKATTDPVIAFLSLYDLGAVSPVPWLKPLKEMRNRTTHRPITDVCDVTTWRRGDLLDENTQITSELYLNKNLFSPADPDRKLCDFVQESFQGLIDFVEELYRILIQEVQDQGSLPLS